MRTRRTSHPATSVTVDTSESLEPESLSSQEVQVSRGKTFADLKGLRWKPKPETYDEMGAKRPLHYRDPDHRKHHEALTAAGTKDEWCDHILGTLTANVDHIGPKGIVRLWRKTLKAYNSICPSTRVGYNLTANRGPLGACRASAHLIFTEGRDGLPNFDLLERCWRQVSGAIGGDWELTSAGGRATLYWSKNATEPHAIEEHYLYKWTREELAKVEEDAEGEPRPAAPVSRREHQPAVITRRNGEEIRRGSPASLKAGFPACSVVFDQAPAHEDPPWIRRANEAWARWRKAAA